MEYNEEVSPDHAAVVISIATNLEKKGSYGIKTERKDLETEIPIKRKHGLHQSSPY